MDNSDPRLKQSRAALTLGALGIVFGDIGTSPLYAVKETFADDEIRPDVLAVSRNQR